MTESDSPSSFPSFEGGASAGRTVGDGNILEAHDVGVQFRDRWVLRNLQFRIQPGEFVAIVGPSGCGKTTLLRLLAGLSTPSAGSIDISPGTRRGYVFQEPNLLPWRTALDNVRLPLQLRDAVNEEGSDDDGLDRQSMRARALDALSLVGLTVEDAAKFPRELSGGMRMRASLARALVNQPQLLLLDEPFAAVDDLTRQRLNDELLALWSRGNWTGVLVTHNLAEAVYLSQRCWLLTGDPSEPIQSIEVRRGAESHGGNWRSRPEFLSQLNDLTSRLHAVTMRSLEGGESLVQ